VPATLTINGVAHRTPDHMREGNKYAFKPAVIWDALEREEAVFWIDAGAEIRRPVDGVREILRDTGYFSVEHAFKFPDTRFHHPACVAQLGCDAVEGSRQHCATTYLGFRRRGGNCSRRCWSAAWMTAASIRAGRTGATTGRSKRS